MENKSEQIQLLNKKTALRRLHYSHPIAVHKANQLEKGALQDGDLEERKKLVKSAPLLSRRFKVSVNRSLIDEAQDRKPASSRKDENGNYLSSSLQHNDLIAQDMVMFASFEAKKANENSSEVEKSRKHYTKQLVPKEKPTLITALQINRYNIENKSKQTVLNAKEKPIALLRQDFNKFNIGMRGKLPKNEPTALMFQQWGIRKCTRSASGKFCNSWADDRLNLEAWSQSVYAFKYKPVQGEIRKKRSAADCIKQAKAKQMAPNPSPNHSDSSHNGKVKGPEGEDCKHIMQRKSDKNGTEVKVEIVLSPPKEERAKDLNKKGIDKINKNCLSPSIDNFFKKDCEPPPSKVSDQTTEILQDIDLCNGSNKALALGEIIETIREDNAGHNMSPEV